MEKKIKKTYSKGIQTLKQGKTVKSIVKPLKQSYTSPRWSGEILDCSMPMAMDTYNKCSYNCLYCFSFFQKSHTPGKDKYQHSNYHKAMDLTSVNTNNIVKLFNNTSELNKTNKQFSSFIKNKKVMQWGGLSDPFDEYERRYGITYQLLKDVFKPLEYPLCFSTKATWWLYDKKYLELFKDADYWNVKFSIINLDEKIAKGIEKGVPSPKDRLEAIKIYSKLNKGGSTLRLRPFIIGMSDLNGDYLKLIKKAYKAGSRAVSTEFFCLEERADDRLKARYNEMSRIVNFDILNFYRQFSKNPGYKRLNYEAKRPYIDKMKSLCDKLGMRFYVSDAHHKEKSCNGSCCGLPESWNYSRGQFTEALLIAKKKGRVYFKDIKKDIESFKNFRWRDACGFNTGGMLKREERNNWTMYDYIRKVWNTPNDRNSPYKYFSGILLPEKVDKSGNVVYAYRGK